MSESFSTVQVRDSRLNCKSSVKYAVEVGAAQITVSESMAQSESVNSHIYNIIVPSETTIIDRRVEWSSTVEVSLSFTNLPAGNVTAYDVLEYGGTCALAAYPLHAACTTMSATINNNTVTINMDDTLSLLQRFMDRSHIAKYTSTTPVMPDNYLLFTDADGTSNNPLGAYNNTDKAANYHGRGALPLLSKTISINGGAAAPGSTYNAAVGGSAVVTISFKTTEPFMCSPFIYSHDLVNSQGFYGVSNMNFRFNINPQAYIVNWVAKPGSPMAGQNIPTVKIEKFTDSKLTFVYMTPKPSMLLPYKNVVSFMEIPRFLSQGQALNLQPGAKFTQSINQVQLNQVPDKLAFQVRLKKKNVTSTDSRMPISRISLNWNNSSGILSSANQEKLWLMSVEAGCNQSWYEFSGKAYTYKPSNPVVTTTLSVPLAGGFLVLDFAKHIQLTEDYYAPGSIGQFSLQAQLTFENHTADAINPGDYEIITYVINSGVWVTERGTCSQYTAILTKQDVLDAASKKPYYNSDVDRIVGAGMVDNLKSSVGAAMAGEGQSGGGASGGKMEGEGASGGKRRR